MEGAFIAKRYTTEMGTVAIYDQPLILAWLHTDRIRLGIAKARNIRVLRCFNFGRRPVTNEYQFAAPEKFDDLAFGDGRKVEINRRAGCNRCRIWRHLADKRPNGRCQADRTGGACRYKEKIASRGFGRGRCVSCCHFVILAPSAPSAGLREEMFASVIPEFGWRRWLPSRSSNVIDRYRSQKLPISRRHVT